MKRTYILFFEAIVWFYPDQDLDHKLQCLKGVCVCVSCLEYIQRSNQLAQREIEMAVQQLVVFQLILLLWPSAVEPYLARPGCNDRCGNVVISYPFGMGTDCFIDDWFEISCRQNGNGNSKPFLEKLNLEVLEIFDQEYSASIEVQYGQILISRPGNLIRVNNPVFSSNCSHSNASSPGIPVNFTGSPFVYSQMLNRFTAVGCHSKALMTHIEPCISGCVSPCGGGCCHITIPSNLHIFNVSLETGVGCKYAFLAEKNLSSLDSSCVADIQDLGEYAPAVLEWGIFNSSVEALSLREQSRNPTSPIICDDSTGMKGTIQCLCMHGYSGTAYLQGSCQDINECAVNSNICRDQGRGGTCINEIGSYRCDDGKFRMKTGAVIGLSCGLGLPILMFVLWWLHKAIKKRNKIKRKKMFFKQNGGLLLEQQVTSSQGNVETTKVFPSKELEIATDRFNKNRILGHGGQGTVYKGMLSDGRIVAVKKSKVENEGTFIEQFINEVVILSQINHRNIVKLLGCCLETEVPLLVYEFVPNGTLSEYLHGQVEDFIVSWEMRLQIATEVAGALSYLHSAASIPIYHRDIKSSNILLDDKCKAKVADFGTSRSVSIEQTHLTTVVHGTFGYLDPEYFQSSQFTDKSDVYSFGVVLVELITGQKAISSFGIQGGRSLATNFIMTMEENQLPDILDPQVASQGGKHEVMAFASLAKRCLDLNGRNRPTMAEVRMELERISKLHKSTNGNGEAHYEEVEFVRSQELEPWDYVTTSTGSVSAMDIYKAASADSQPLLPDPIW